MFSSLLFIVQLLVAVFIIRFHVNMYRLGINPIVSRLNDLTAPLVRPFQRLINRGRYDFAALLVAWIVAILGSFVIFHSFANALILGTLLAFLSTWLNVVMYALFLVVIASWLQTDPRQPIMQIALSCTEWVMAPLRSVIPTLGGLDFSPIVVLLGIGFLKNGVAKLALSSVGM